ncbi:MAG: hypothetical protein H6565_14380 [Lewinellaceae bacterium]|nr:hypothetical protein [Lewinellaceae bacterium]
MSATQTTKLLRITALTISLGLAAGLNAVCAQVSAIANLRPERVETGDTTSLWILVSGVRTEPGRVIFGAWASIIPSANIISRNVKWRRSGKQWVIRYTLLAFDSASLELPPLKISYGTGETVSTNALGLTVFPTPGAGLEEMADIREIQKEAIHWSDHWPWGAAGAAALLLLYVLFRKKRRRPKPVQVAIPQQPATPLPTPYEHALRQLETLKRNIPDSEETLQDYYARISLILREYLENRFAIPALESTTPEVKSMLADSSFPSELKKMALEVLSRADLVKYARSAPAVAAREKILEDTRLFVVKSHHAFEQQVHQN